ncbi:NAD-dependent epimerase/dehydratase family protein [Imperialibacter roseus]|uniref:NAD-dependent epimerase/dehydratase family protein n=1 Tax=Imperialibacter roseus TaxID=1324217 RepID=A0ABZ0IQ11_9BACT|nr:NAD-dependent epimerase/dehydratase family protein [Imperialibacter roseus]WOK06269.1 NAD-dependent epimerase/dehydratase family protein [Imperialibacter roseus]
MTKVLISGASGFVGSNLKVQLQDVKISTLGRSENDNFSWENLNSESLDGTDVIIHLAGLAHDTNNSLFNSKDYYSVNVELTRTLYDAFTLSKAKVFIFTSTIKAEGVSANELTINGHERVFNGGYALSKRLAEEYILSNLPQDKKVYILRPCMIHGSNNKGNLNLLFQYIRKGFPFPLGSFENRRSFLFVDNLSFVVQKLLEGNIPSGRYNIADDGELSTIEVVKLIDLVLEKNTNIWNIPKSLILVLAKFGDLLKLSQFNSNILFKLTSDQQVDNSKIMQLLSIEKLPISIREGIIRTIKSF